MNKIISLETKKYELRLDNFEGPLDLLCNLIEKNKNCLIVDPASDFEIIKKDKKNRKKSLQSPAR